MDSEKEIYKAKSVHCDEDHVTFEREERDQLRITATMYPWPVNDEPRKPDVISIVVDGDDAVEIACEIMNAYQVENITETQQQATIEALRRRVAELEDDLNAGRELMRTAWSEMNAIRARDGAPSGVSHEWWSAITDQLQHLLKDDAKPWMLGAARLMLERHETNKIKAAEGVRDTYVQIADEYSRKAKSLTAENAELKRRVEALREDAEVGALVKELLKDAGHINFVAQDARGCYVQRCKKSGGWLPEHFGANILEALREAAKGVVEG